MVTCALVPVYFLSLPSWWQRTDTMKAAAVLTMGLVAMSMQGEVTKASFFFFIFC